jgi:hypothetical protein
VGDVVAPPHPLPPPPSAMLRVKTLVFRPSGGGASTS